MYRPCETGVDCVRGPLLLSGRWAGRGLMSLLRRWLHIQLRIGRRGRLGRSARGHLLRGRMERGHVFCPPRTINLTRRICLVSASVEMII
jgi:hypothetical protein